MTDDYEVLEFTYRKPVKQDAYTALNDHRAVCKPCRYAWGDSDRCEYGNKLYHRWLRSK